MKKWYQSKTVVANIITAIVALCALIPSLISDLGVSAENAKMILASVLFVSNALNILLRMFFTKETISNQ